ncbi:MAG: chromosome segregation protein SMC [Janthinobacterium lividum]
MRLKRLQLQGFKTFADKTEIEFAAGVTAIVGPNGSGKSNIGDAVLWVLGEQKASALRGAKASDVIFAGSEGRRAMGMAEVSLTVDNSDGGLPIEFGEVTITRRAYRTGEGEYFLNKTPCRLKDIYELFLDTGVGRESYSLVNQGQIDAVLSVNAEDRRGLFEEAAGIKKYRVKKREALRKLEATETNLLRVRDIQSEIVGRVEPLRRQAERAERHQALKDRLKIIESSLLIVDLRFAAFESNIARQAREEEQAAAAQYGERLAAAEARAQGIAQRHAEAEANLEACRQAHGAAIAAAERAESGRALAIQRADGLRQTQRLLAGELEELAGRRERFVRQIADLEAELTEARTEEAALRRDVNIRQADVQALAEKTAGLTRQAERRRSESLTLARQQAAREADAARAAARVTELEASLPLIAAEAGRLETAAVELQAEWTAARAAVDAAKVALAAAETAVTEALGKRDAQRAAVQAAQAKGSAAQSAAVALSTRLRTLQELENVQEGYFAGVKSVFEAKKHGALRGEFTVVADSFQTPAGFEVALETALAASLQDIITDTEEAAKAAIAYLHEHRAGRATFLPLDRMRPGRDSLDIRQALGMTGVLGAALDIVSFDAKFAPALEVLLGRVFICETLDDALRASAVAKGWNRVVTRSGEIVLPSGALTGGRQSGRTANILGRKTEIASGQVELAAKEKAREAAQTELAQAEAGREAAERALSEAQAGRQSALGSKTDAERRAERAGQESRRAEEARTQSAKRIDSAHATLAQAREHAGRTVSVLASGTMETTGADETQAIEAEQLALLTIERDGLQAELTSVRISLATISEKTSSLDRAGRSARGDQSSLAAQEKRKAGQAAAGAAELETLTVQSAARELEVVAARSARTAAQSALDTQNQARQVLLQESYEANAQMRSLGEARAKALEAVHKNEVQEARLGVQRDTLAGRLWEEYEVSLEDALALAEDPEVPDGTPQEVIRLRRDLRILGDVNPAAIAEYAEVSARHEFLLTQAADLDESRAKLLTAIQEIDEGTRGVFLETFQAVGAAFETIFTRLFGGGKTELVLTTPNDILETGVDILVQPPGKKRQNLALLSGGERALTAAALLFAFLYVKPSPFCVLDEVDAPLDGANVERFADLLREFGLNTQMIVITHNPTTMEAAPVWYGVTMSHPGISRVLGMQVPASAG